MSPAAVYVHFKSKEELLFRICVAGTEQMLALSRQAVRSSEDPVEQLASMFRWFVRDQALEPAKSRVVNFEWNALEAANHKQVARMRSSLADGVKQVVAAGMATGTFTTEDESLTALALTSLGSDVCRWYRPSGGYTPEQVADHYAELALRMVGARDENRSSAA